MGVVDYNPVLEIQPGGSGAGDWQYAYQSKELSGMKMDAVSGGELTYQHYYATDYGQGAQQVPIGSRRSGNPTPYKIPLSFPVYATQTTRQLLRNLVGIKNIRVRLFNGDVNNRNNYYMMFGWIRAVNTQLPGAFDGSLMNGQDQPADLASRLWPQEADAYVEWSPLTHRRLSTSITTLQVNAAVPYGYPRNAGDVVGEVGNNDGLQEFLAVTIADGSNLPHILYTTDQGSSWTDRTGTGLTNFTGTGIALVGENVVISGSGAGGGLAWSKLADVLAGAVTPTRSTNISAGTVVNAVARITGQQAIAVGNTGAVYISTDGGKTFSSAGTAVTANNLTWVSVYDDTLQIMGGASGALVLRKNGVMSLLASGGWSTTALNCGEFAQAFSRTTQVFVGTAAGDIYFCPDVTASSPTWTRRYAAGSGAIDGIRFCGPDGCTCFFIWTNGSTQSVVRRDFTGGYFSQVEDLGTVTSPANSSFNAIAVPKFDVNTAIVVGDVNTSAGYVGLIAA